MHQHAAIALAVLIPAVSAWAADPLDDSVAAETSHAKPPLTSSGPHDLVDTRGDVKVDWLDLLQCTVNLTETSAEVRMVMAEPLPSMVNVDRGPRGAQLLFQASFDTDNDPTTGCRRSPMAGSDVIVSAWFALHGPGPTKVALTSMATRTVRVGSGCHFSHRLSGGAVEVDGDTLIFSSPLHEAISEDAPMRCYVSRVTPRSDDCVPAGWCDAAQDS